MKNVFQNDTRHKIVDANINFYSQPFTHPERIMKEHDFIYMLEGEWKFGQNEELFTLKKDMILILTSGNKHFGVAPCSPKTKTLYFHASCEEGDYSFSSNTENAQEGCVMIDTLIDVSRNKNVKKYFFNIVENKLSGNDRKANIYFDLLLCELSGNTLSTTENEPESKIIDIIHSNPEKFFSNVELAQIANVSVKTAENKFKEKYKKTIHQYILDFKIDEAISYFNNFPQLRIKEIAYNLGFYDEYHFSKQFKKITGVSPSVYKKQL